MRTYIHAHTHTHTTEAGKAFQEAAEIHLKLDTKHEAATHLVEAGQVLKKDLPTGKELAVSHLT